MSLLHHIWCNPRCQPHSDTFHSQMYCNGEGVVGSNNVWHSKPMMNFLSVLAKSWTNYTSCFSKITRPLLTTLLCGLDTRMDVKLSGSFLALMSQGRNLSNVVQGLAGSVWVNLPLFSTVERWFEGQEVQSVWSGVCVSYELKHRTKRDFEGLCIVSFQSCVDCAFDELAQACATCWCQFIWSPYLKTFLYFQHQNGFWFLGVYDKVTASGAHLRLRAKKSH